MLSFPSSGFGYALYTSTDVNVLTCALQYAVLLEPRGVEQARAVLQRGLHIQVQPPLSYQLAVIAFEEAHGDVAKARFEQRLHHFGANLLKIPLYLYRTSYQSLAQHKQSLASVEFVVRYANFEKRNGNKDLGVQLYSQAASLFTVLEYYAYFRCMLFPRSSTRGSCGISDGISN